MSAGPYGALLDELRGVRWPAARRVSGATLGAHPSTLRGNSSEFSEFRPYRQGDDPRRLDWRLLARSDRAYVRLTTDRATLRTSIICDASASMAFPSVSLDKWRLARECAVGLAAVAHADADPIGLSIAADRPVTLAPRARRSALLEMMRALDATQPGGAPGLASHVRDVHASRVLVITDLLGDLEEMSAVARLRRAAGDEVIVVHVVAAEELEPPRDARLAMDPERPDLRRTLDDDTRAAYMDAFAAWRAETAAMLRAVDVRYEMAVTTESAVRAIRRVAGGGTRVGG